MFKTFKGYLKDITAAKTEEELLQIFNGPEGVDMAYQREKLSWTDQQILLDIIEKIRWGVVKMEG